MIAGISGATGEQIIINKLVGYFPRDVNHAVDASTTATNVQLLAQSPLVAFAGESLRGQVQVVCDHIMRIKMKFPPEFEKGKCAATVQRCIDLASNFPRFQKNEKAVILKGWAAIEGRYHEIHRMLNAKKDDEKEKLNHDLLSDLKVFWWSVPDEWQDTITACEAHLQEKNGVVVAGGGSSSSGAAAPPAKRAKGAASSSSSGPSKEVLLRGSVLGRI